VNALTGRSFGVYQVEAPLGAGGMGEVYRARDTRLGRDVAIKILPPEFANDPERLKRFEREARTLATLNHPNIGAIYGIEDVDGVRALVLELVDGETLADRIAGGSLSTKDAIAVARQIIDALDAAHERGVVHRDLKPSNVALTRDGTVKVLDFGIAKTNNEKQSEATSAPTRTLDRTRDGTILGTAAYMSPEQARGQTIDKRTDIWAFGCVLYEMLTGRAVFARGTTADTIAAIVEGEADWSALPSATPEGVRRCLARCLDKDPKSRLRDIADARVELDATRSTDHGPGEGAEAKPRRWIWLVGAAAVCSLALLIFAAAGGRLGSSSLDTSAYRFVPLAVGPADETSPAWSPDGKSIVYVADVAGVSQLFTRSLDADTATQITRSATDCLTPFWSPDAARVYFISGRDADLQLWSVGAAGGDPQPVLENAAAATISPDGKTIAFLRGPGGNRSLWITATGRPDPQQYRTPPFPQTFGLSNSVEFSRDGSKLAVLVRRQEGASYASELWILPYPTGTPRRVLDRIPDAAFGHLSWLPDGRRLIWDSAFPDRIGVHLYLLDTERATVQPVTSGTLDQRSPSVSPDGERIAFAEGSEDFDLIDVALDGSEVRTLLATARSETRPSWSPTGKQLLYITNARGASEIWERSIDDAWTRPVVKQDIDDPLRRRVLQRPSYSPDGRRIVYELLGTTHSIYVASAADGRGVPLDQDSPDQHSPAWSPDGKWIAYQRLHGTSWELVKVPSGGGTPVALAVAPAGGGDHTAWSPSGAWIAHVLGGALHLTSADDGHAQKTLSGAPPAAFGFSANGASLYAVRPASSTTWELATFDVQSGQQQKVTALRLPSRATISGFSLDPDGHGFATSIGNSRHDIWLLEGFKR